MGAEPFFFKQAEGQNPQKVYARVMKFFVITITIMFLVVAMYIDIWKYFLSSEPGKLNIYWTGLKVVPILLLANMFLGIYYNLSIWYKLTHKTIAGAYITLIGAALTLLINFYFYSPFWLYGLCMGNFFMLRKHDGYFFYLGAKGLSYSLCLEKTYRLYCDCGSLIFSS